MVVTARRTGPPMPILLGLGDEGMLLGGGAVRGRSRGHQTLLGITPRKVGTRPWYPREECQETRFRFLLMPGLLLLLMPGLLLLLMPGRSAKSRGWHRRPV